MLARLTSYLILIIFTVIIGIPVQARAEEKSSESIWTISAGPAQNPAITEKGYFVYPMKKGMHERGSVLLKNPGEQPVTIDLASVDAQTGQTGGTAFAPVDAPVAAVGKWVELEARQVTLLPGTQQSIGFTVHAPDAITSGQYLAGIAAFEAKATTVEQENAAEGFKAIIEINRRYVIGVQIDVGNEWAPLLNILGARVVDQAANTMLEVRMRNDGAMFIKPSGTVAVTDAQGKVILTEAITLDTFVTGTELAYTLPWVGEALPGQYTVAVEMDYADGKRAVYNDTIEISGEVAALSEQHADAVQPSALSAAAPAPAPSPIQPWMIYAIGALLLLIVVLLVLNLLRGRAKQQSS